MQIEKVYEPSGSSRIGAVVDRFRTSFALAGTVRRALVFHSSFRPPNVTGIAAHRSHAGAHLPKIDVTIRWHRMLGGEHALAAGHRTTPASATQMVVERKTGRKRAFAARTWAAKPSRSAFGNGRPSTATNIKRAMIPHGRKAAMVARALHARSWPLAPVRESFRAAV